MWVFFENGTFYSAVTDKADEEVKWVRTRDKRSAEIFRNWLRLENVTAKPKPEILEWKNRDYKFRIKTTPEMWETFVTEQTRSSKATNFKDEVAKNLGYANGSKFLHALHEVWGVMFDYQNERGYHFGGTGKSGKKKA